MYTKRPVVDIGRCTLCGGCVEVAPNIFRINEAFGFLEVIEANQYEQADVDEAIKICPEDCIEWDD